MTINKDFFKHLPTCYMEQDWDRARLALSDTPERFRDGDWHAANQEVDEKQNTCTCGLDKFIAYIEVMEESNINLYDGRKYLMGVDPEKLTVEDTLEALGFGRDGLSG